MTEQCRADSALTRDVVCLLTFQAQSAGLSLICCDAMQSKKNTRSVTHTNTRCKLCLRQNVGLHHSGGSLVSADLVWSTCTLLTSRTPEVLMHGYLLGRVVGRRELGGEGGNYITGLHQWSVCLKCSFLFASEGCGGARASTPTASPGPNLKRSRVTAFQPRHLDNQQVSTS